MSGPTFSNLLSSCRSKRHQVRSLEPESKKLPQGLNSIVVTVRPCPVSSKKEFKKTQSWTYQRTCQFLSDLPSRCVPKNDLGVLSLAGLAGRGQNGSVWAAAQAENFITMTIKLLKLWPKSVLDQSLFWRRYLVLFRLEIKVRILIFDMSSRRLFGARVGLAFKHGLVGQAQGGYRGPLGLSQVLSAKLLTSDALPVLQEDLGGFKHSNHFLLGPGGKPVTIQHGQGHQVVTMDLRSSNFSPDGLALLGSPLGVGSGGLISTQGQEVPVIVVRVDTISTYQLINKALTCPCVARQGLRPDQSGHW